MKKLCRRNDMEPMIGFVTALSHTCAWVALLVFVACVVSDVRLRMLVLISSSVWRKDVRPWGALGMLSSIGSVVVYLVLFPWFKSLHRSSVCSSY